MIRKLLCVFALLVTSLAAGAEGLSPAEKLRFKKQQLKQQQADLRWEYRDGVKAKIDKYLLKSAACFDRFKNQATAEDLKKISGVLAGEEALGVGISFIFSCSDSWVGISKLQSEASAGLLATKYGPEADDYSWAIRETTLALGSLRARLEKELKAFVEKESKAFLKALKEKEKASKESRGQSTDSPSPEAPSKP